MQKRKWEKPRGDGVKLRKREGRGLIPALGRPSLKPIPLPHTPPPGRNDVSKVPPPPRERGHVGMVQAEGQAPGMTQKRKNEKSIFLVQSGLCSILRRRQFH